LHGSIDNDMHRTADICPRVFPAFPPRFPRHIVFATLVCVLFLLRIVLCIVFATLVYVCIHHVHTHTYTHTHTHTHTCIRGTRREGVGQQAVTGTTSELQVKQTLAILPIHSRVAVKVM